MLDVRLDVGLEPHVGNTCFGVVFMYLLKVIVTVSCIPPIKFKGNSS